MSSDLSDHYPFQPSDWSDFDTPVGGCVVDGVYPPDHCATQLAALKEWKQMFGIKIENVDYSTMAVSNNEIFPESPYGIQVDK